MLINSKKSLKQNKNSKRFLQPPALRSFDLLSSMSSQDRQQKMEQKMDVLSNVEEKSYFSCEQSDIKPPECIEPVMITKQLQEQQPVVQSRKSLRIEDQAIIVVEEEVDLSQNNAEESVILQHIEFKSDTHAHESTPNWEQQREEYGKYDAVNYIQDPPPWLRQEDDNLSDSMHADFSNSQLKIPKNRISKNTCIDRAEHKELVDFQKNLRHSNKSCIAKPMGNSNDIRQELSILKSKQGEKDKFYQIQYLLDKKYEPTFLIEKQSKFSQSSNQLDVQKDSKFCFSRESKEVQSKNSNEHNSDSRKLQSKIEINDAYTQTELSGKQLLQNEVYLNEQITFLKSRIKKLQDQNIRYKQETSQHLNQMIIITESIAAKDKQIMEMKQEKQQKIGVEFKRLMDKNIQLQKVISMQHNLIKEYQQASQSQTKLSKLQSTNIISRSLQKAATFGRHSDSLKLFELEMSSDRDERNLHKQCRRQNQQLQQYIFDLQQRLARVDAEVERKIKAVTVELQQQISIKCNDQYAAIIDALKDELSQSRQSLKRFQRENRMSVEEWSQREMKIKNREFQLSKMYNELVKEWQSIQKEKQQSRKSKSRSKDFANCYSPKMTEKQSRGYFQAVKDVSDIRSMHFQFSSQEMKNPKSTRDLLRYSKKETNQGLNKYHFQNNIFQRQNNRLGDKQRFLPTTKHFGHNSYKQKRQPFKMNAGDSHELSIINHKIQKLRNQITRELDSIQ